MQTICAQVCGGAVRQRWTRISPALLDASEPFYQHVEERDKNMHTGGGIGAAERAAQDLLVFIFGDD